MRFHDQTRVLLTRRPRHLFELGTTAARCRRAYKCSSGASPPPAAPGAWEENRSPREVHLLRLRLCGAPEHPADRRPRPGAPRQAGKRAQWVPRPCGREAPICCGERTLTPDPGDGRGLCDTATLRREWGRASARSGSPGTAGAVLASPRACRGPPDGRGLTRLGPELQRARLPGGHWLTLDHSTAFPAEVRGGRRPVCCPRLPRASCPHGASCTAQSPWWPDAHHGDFRRL